MKFKIIGPVVMCVMLILTACNTVSENFESESKLSDVSASESNSADMKTETIDNETWYYIETESQLRSIADSDTTLAQNYIQNTNIELTSEWISIGDDEHPFTGKYNGNGYTISGLCYPVGEKKYTGLFGYSKGGEMYNITLISPDTTNADGAHNGAIVAICLDGGGSHDNVVLDRKTSVPES